MPPRHREGRRGLFAPVRSVPTGLSGDASGSQPSQQLEQRRYVVPVAGAAGRRWEAQRVWCSVSRREKVFPQLRHSVSSTAPLIIRKALRPQCGHLFRIGPIANSCFYSVSDADRSASPSATSAKLR